jgi:hypothetical protein
VAPTHTHAYTQPGAGQRTHRMSIIADKCRPKFKQQQFRRRPCQRRRRILAVFCALSAITSGFAAFLSRSYICMCVFVITWRQRERKRVASRLRHRFNFEIMNAPTTNPAAGKKMTRGSGANPPRCHRTRVFLI